MRDRTLDRLIRIGLAIVVIGVGFEVADRFFDLRGNDEPSLLERQITAAEDAVRAKPNEIGLRLRLAEVYRAADRSDDALAQYDEVLKLESVQGTALLGRGEVLAEQGDNAAAIKAYKKLIGEAGGEEFAGVNPQLAGAHYGLGSVLLEEGRAKKAMKEARQAVEVEPTDADALYLLGAAAVEAGSPRPAVKALRQAVLFVPSGWCEPYERLAEAYADLGRKAFAEYAEAMVDLCEERPEEASSRLRPLTSGPVAVDAMLGLGMAAEAESKRTAAVRWYRKVLAADAGNFNARANLGRLAGSQPGTDSLPPEHPGAGGA
jgi:tetratricopeptide (TPR) repeat protein